MFNLCGQLLVILYIMNENKVNKNDIKYCDETFNIMSKSVDLGFTTKLNKFTSESIINDILNKSVYYIECIPEDIKDISLQEFKELEKGFEFAYEIFIKEKLQIIKMMEFKNINIPSVIKTISLLNPYDLQMQLKILELKYNENNNRNTDLITIKNKRVNFDNVVEKVYSYSELAIKSGIIGYGEYGLEVMWIEFANNKLRATQKNNIYFTLIFAFIFKNQNKEYYLEAVRKSIYPVMSYINSDIKNNRISKEDIKIFKLLVMLNQYIYLKELDEFIYINKNILLKENVNLIIEKALIDDYIFNYVCNKCINYTKKVMIEHNFVYN